MELKDMFLMTKVEKLVNDIPNLDFYSMCNNHIKSKDNLDKVPMMNIDIRSSTWGIQTDDMETNEIISIEERMWEEFTEWCGWTEEEQGIEVFTDLNGYRVLLSSDIYNLNNEVEEVMENLESVEDEEERDDYCEELEDLYPRLKEEIEKVNKFIKLEDGLKEWVKDYPKYYEEYKAELKEEERLEEMQRVGQETLKC